MSVSLEKRSYSPQLSDTASVSIRRLAWALGMHMTTTLELIIQSLPSIVNSSKVCLSCEDNTRCKFCVFINHSNPAALAELSLQD